VIKEITFFSNTETTPPAKNSTQKQGKKAKHNPSLSKTKVTHSKPQTKTTLTISKTIHTLHTQNEIFDTKKNNARDTAHTHTPTYKTKTPKSTIQAQRVHINTKKKTNCKEFPRNEDQNQNIHEQHKPVT
jgi:hypothetical protein